MIDNIDSGIKALMKTTLTDILQAPKGMRATAGDYVTRTWDKHLWELKKIAQAAGDQEAHKEFLSHRKRINNNPVYRYLDGYEDIKPIYLHYIHKYIEDKGINEPTPEEWIAIRQIYEDGLAEIRAYIFKYFTVKLSKKKSKEQLAKIMESKQAYENEQG